MRTPASSAAPDMSRWRPAQLAQRQLGARPCGLLHIASRVAASRAARSGHTSVLGWLSGTRCPLPPLHRSSNLHAGRLPLRAA